MTIQEIKTYLKKHYFLIFRYKSKYYSLKRDQILLKPIYSKTACYGHFGREEFPWEKVKKLKMGRDGILSSELKQCNADVLHVTPFFSYPTNVTTSILKRYEYLKWAKNGKYIVEDAKIYPTLDDFYQSQRIDFKVASTGMAGGSYNLSRIPLRPEELGESMNVSNKIAILFGREGNGLTNKEIEDCDICVSIPTDPTYPIMNISHAAAIIFYELFKNKHDYGVQGLEESSELEKEYLISTNI